MGKNSINLISSSLEGYGYNLGFVAFQEDSGNLNPGDLCSSFRSTSAHTAKGYLCATFVTELFAGA